MSRPKALVFDLGGVIVAHDNAVMHNRLASRCASDWTADRVAAVTGDDRWATGRPVSELHAELRDTGGYTGDWATFVDDWCCHLVLIPSMLTLVEDLAAAHRVLIFSNTNLQHWSRVLAISGGRLGAFERVLSYEIGVAKPAARAFDRLIHAVGLPPADLLFFDDVATNVEGARRSGLRAEVFVGEGALRSLLFDRGLGS